MIKEYKPSPRTGDTWLLSDAKTRKSFEVDEVPNAQILEKAGLQYKNPDMFLSLYYDNKVATLTYVGKTVENYELHVQEYNKD